jgi:DNA-binding MarR family transcriptional regulator
VEPQSRSAPGDQPVPAGYTERLGLLVHRLALELAARGERELAEVHLSGRQYVAMTVLAADHPGSQQELGKLMGLAPQAIVALADELEERGLATRRPDPDDRRRTRIELTAEGQRALSRADEATRRVEDDVFASLDPRDRARLHELLRRAFTASYTASLPADLDS